MSESHTDREMVTVTVQTDVVPTFDLSYPKDSDETDKEAHERALELASHDASIALSETAHEYDWTETDSRRKENRIGTLVIDENAGVNDIEAMVEMGLESVPGIELVSNQNGTYDILDKGANDTDEAPIDEPYAVVHFTPQAWVDDKAVAVEPQGSQTWKVPFDDVLNDEDEIVKDDSHESDDLHMHERAPEWVRNWSGPFYVQINEIRGLPKDETPGDYR